MKVALKIALFLGVLVVPTVLVGGSAGAASWNSVTGSDTTGWVTGSTLRHITAPSGPMVLGLEAFQSGQQWRLMNTGGGVMCGPYNVVNTGGVTMCSEPAGTNFYNAYRASAAGPFSGIEWY